MRRITCLLPVVALVLLCASPALCLIDINTASEDELDSLPGIGEVYAKRIIEGRPYRSINDLKRLKGLGGKTFDKFKDMIMVGTAKKEAPAKVVKQEPIEVPIYSVESYKQLKCHGCKNTYKASSELKGGWCPYCGARWRVKEAESPPPKSSAKAEAAPGAISFEEAGNYVGQTKTVAGTVVDTHVSARSGNLYLNFHQDYRAYLSVEIPASDLGKFRSDADSYYTGKKIISTGEIRREDDGKYLRMIVTDPANLKVVE